MTLFLTDWSIFTHLKYFLDLITNFNVHFFLYSTGLTSKRLKKSHFIDELQRSSSGKIEKADEDKFVDDWVAYHQHCSVYCSPL